MTHARVTAAPRLQGLSPRSEGSGLLPWAGTARKLRLGGHEAGRSCGSGLWPSGVMVLHAPGRPPAARSLDALGRREDAEVALYQTCMETLTALHLATGWGAKGAFYFLTH